MGMQGAVVGARPDARALEEPNDRSNRRAGRRRADSAGEAIRAPKSHAVLRNDRFPFRISTEGVSIPFIRPSVTSGHAALN